MFSERRYEVLKHCENLPHVLNHNLKTQNLVRSDELRVVAPYDKVERTSIDITDDQIKYLNNLSKHGLK